MKTKINFVEHLGKFLDESIHFPMVTRSVGMVLLA